MQMSIILNTIFNIFEFLIGLFCCPRFINQTIRNVFIIFHFPSLEFISQLCNSFSNNLYYSQNTLCFSSNKGFPITRPFILVLFMIICFRELKKAGEFVEVFIVFRYLIENILHMLFLNLNMILLLLLTMFQYPKPRLALDPQFDLSEVS